MAQWPLSRFSGALGVLVSLWVQTGMSQNYEAEGTVRFQSHTRTNETAARFRVAVKGNQWAIRILPLTGTAIQHMEYVYDGLDTYKYTRLRLSDGATQQHLPPAATGLVSRLLKSPSVDTRPEGSANGQAQPPPPPANTGTAEVRSGPIPGPVSQYALVLWLALLPHDVGAFRGPSPMPVAWPLPEEDNLSLPVEAEPLAAASQFFKGVTYFSNESAVRGADGSLRWGENRMLEAQYVVSEAIKGLEMLFPKTFGLVRYHTERTANSDGNPKRLFGYYGEIERVAFGSVGEINLPVLPESESTYITDFRVGSITPYMVKFGYLGKGNWMTLDQLSADSRFRDAILMERMDSSSRGKRDLFKRTIVILFMLSITFAMAVLVNGIRKKAGKP